MGGAAGTGRGMSVKCASDGMARLIYVCVDWGDFWGQASERNDKAKSDTDFHLAPRV